MSRDIFIAGENGEVYHITEDHLKAAHRVAPQDLPSVQHLMQQLPDREHGVTYSLGKGGVSQAQSEHIQLLKLGTTHDDDT